MIAGGKPITIVVTYRSVDGGRMRRTFKTKRGAQRFAVTYVGETPDIGNCYAVSRDGIGTIYVSGISLEELFAAE